MKKIIKNVLKASLILWAIHSVNKLIHYSVNKYIEKDKTTFFDWRFGKIKYRKIGKGKPLLLIHNTDIGHSGLEWDNVILRLSKKFRVYTIDLLGYGLSEKPNLTYSPYLYANLINDFINNIICEKTSVAASSDSCGYIAAAYGLNSDNFDKIIFVSPTNEYLKKPGLLGKAIRVPIIGTSLYYLLTTKFALRKYYNSKFINQRFLRDFVDKCWVMAHKCAFCKNAESKNLFLKLSLCSGEKNAGASLFDNELNMDCGRLFSKIDSSVCMIMDDGYTYPHIEIPSVFAERCENFILSGKFNA